MIDLTALAVVVEAPEHLVLKRLPLTSPEADDAVVDIEFSGISTGTERLLWTGTMPPFPGMGYPLVPGYESVGRIVEVGAQSRRRVGERVFVPGALCYGEVRGLFGGAASRVVVPARRSKNLDNAFAVCSVTLQARAAASGQGNRPASPPSTFRCRVNRVHFLVLSD